MSVHFEVRVSGRFDTDRVATAIRQALSLPPLARARLAGAKLSARRLQWEITDDADYLTFEVTYDPVSTVHALTILRWNRSHEAAIGDPVSIMMPVNLRPPEWSAERGFGHGADGDAAPRRDRCTRPPGAGPYRRHLCPGPGRAPQVRRPARARPGPLPEGPPADLVGEPPG